MQRGETAIAISPLVFCAELLGEPGNPRLSIRRSETLLVTAVTSAITTTVTAAISASTVPAAASAATVTAISTPTVSSAAATTWAAAESTTTAASAATWAAATIFTWTSFVHDKFPSLEFSTIQCFDDRVAVVSDFHEGKASGLAGHPVHHYVNRCHRSVLFNSSSQVIGGRLERQIAHVQFHAHA